MSAYAQQIFGNGGPKRPPRIAQILKAGWNMRRPDHQTRPTSVVEIWLPDKIEEQWAKTDEIAASKQQKASPLLAHLLPMNSEEINEKQQQDERQQPRSIIEVFA